MAWKEYSKGKKIGIIVIAVLILGAIGSASSDQDTHTEQADSDQTTNNTSNNQEVEQTAQTPPAEPAPEIGDEVRDGDFAFTVLSLDCGATKIATAGGFLEERAQGHYCKMRLSVKNIKDSPQSFWASDQFVYNDKGQKYSSDTEASILLNDAGTIEDINPGNSITTVVVFDVPVDAKIIKAELHDSGLSGGVEVRLE